MNMLSVKVSLAVAVAVVFLGGCVSQTRAYKPGNENEPVIAKTMSLGSYELQGVNDDERPEADEVAKKFITKFAQDLSEKGLRVSGSNETSELVVTFAVMYRTRTLVSIMLPIPIPIPTGRRTELMVVAAVKRGAETVLAVSGYQPGGIILPVSFFVNSVSKQIVQEFGDKIKLTAPN
ncbi:MAG: hypothetical protein Q7K44_00570 [Candidatus Liptonbacteria bacterium]|nr:hypothetical protein [Candidatus Liptonbacteria bacterium]